MKKYLFLFVTAVSLALFSGRAHAQRYLPGMKGVELRGGFANGSKSPLNYYTGFAVSGYTPKANRWVIGAEYLMKNYGYRDASVPRAQFTAEGGYYLKFLSDPTKTVFLSVGGSALAGYETVNWGERILYGKHSVKSIFYAIYQILTFAHVNLYLKLNEQLIIVT